MGVKYIWIKKQRYYYYESYDSWAEALKQAKRHKKRNKCRYFILPTEDGFLFPEIRYRLYLNKCIKIC